MNQTQLSTHPLRHVFLPMAVAVVADQASKALIVHFVMRPPRVIGVLPHFNLTLGYNEGASFGLLAGVMAGRPLLMATVTGLLTLVFLVMALRSDRWWDRVGLGLVVGGSASNILDRVRQGAVTDFLDIYWRGWHWPTFNMGDVAIVLGVGVLLLNQLLGRRREAKGLV